MWPCGSSNHGEGTSGKFTMQVQQTMLATLSLGPVGIADQLSGRYDHQTASAPFMPFSQLREAIVAQNMH